MEIERDSARFPLLEESLKIEIKLSAIARDLIEIEQDYGLKARFLRY